MRTWLMKRNCSLTPKQVGWFYASICAFSFLIAGFFLALGIWMVIIFTSLDILALTFALYIYTRHALDYEKISIDDKVLVVEQSWGGKLKTHVFTTLWTRLEREGFKGRRLALICSDHSLPIGLFVRQDQFELFEQELKAHLGNR